MSTPSFYINMPAYQYVAVTGDKNRAFLQGQLSCDVNLLTEKVAVFGAYLNTKGRVIATVRIFMLNNQLLLQIPQSVAEVVLTKLNRVAALSRVKLLPCPEINTLGIVTTNAVATDDTALLCINNANQYMLIGTPEIITARVQALGLSAGSDALWHYGLIQNKLIEIDAQTTEQFTPHELDLPSHNAVSFTKGCYVGQEIVARMQYLGKLKQHLQLLQWQQPLCQRLDQLFNDKQQAVGEIISLVNLDNKQYALAVLRDDAKDLPLFTKDHLQLV